MDQTTESEAKAMASANPYYRRNVQLQQAFGGSGVKARHDDLAGGFEGTRFDVDGGYHVHVAQDMDDPHLPWSAAVSHGEDFDPVNGSGAYDVDLGVAHPKAVPALVQRHLQPGGELHSQIREHYEGQKANRPSRAPRR